MEHLQDLFDRQQAKLRAVSTASERRDQLQQLWDAVLAHEGALIEALQPTSANPAKRFTGRCTP